MSKPSVVKGGYFDVAVDVTSLGLSGVTGYVFICGLNTRNLAHKVNTSDNVVPNCQDPESIAWVDRNAISQEKNMSGTGLHNRAQTAIIRAIFGKTLPYRFIEGEPGNDLVSQGYWQGPFLFTDWAEGAADKTDVSSQFTWVSDGEVDWIDTTAATLGTLGLTPLTATAATPWTGTLTGVTPGSTVTATSPGTTLTVVGNTVTGTFATTGSKVVTLTETNAEASNSPHTGTKTVVVS